jgi:hypothetical protein
MSNTVIYDNGNSKLTIEYDGEIVIIRQETRGIGESSIFMYDDEIDAIYGFIQRKKESE